jgi:hypothetical protein
LRASDATKALRLLLSLSLANIVLAVWRPRFNLDLAQ